MTPDTMASVIQVRRDDHAALMALAHGAWVQIGGDMLVIDREYSAEPYWWVNGSEWLRLHSIFSEYQVDVIEVSGA